MFPWAFIFLVLTVVAAVLGYGGLAPSASPVARLLFCVFTVAFTVSGLWSLKDRGSH